MLVDVKPSLQVQGVRARAREQTVNDLLGIARRQLAAEGGAALSLRAIARDAGMVSSAIYRYFPSRDHLLTRLIIDAYNSLGESVEEAAAAVLHNGALARWRTVCNAVRGWATANPHEYALIFGSPIPGYAAPSDTIEPATRVPLVLGPILREAAKEIDLTVKRGTIDGHPVLDPSSRPDLAAIAAILGLPPDPQGLELSVRALMAWTHLFGSISFELFGHRKNVILDHDTFFAEEVDRLATQIIGLTIT